MKNFAKPLDLIEGTSRTIRDVRNYLCALPPSDSVLLTEETKPHEAQHNMPNDKENSLRRRPSLQFRAEKTSTVKAKDAFKRQSSFSGLPRPQLKQSAGLQNGPSHPRSSFTPFATVKRLSIGGSAYNELDTLIDLDVSGRSAQQQGSDEAAQPHFLQSSPSRVKAPDPLAVVRTGALEVLGMLKELESKCRIEEKEMEANESLFSGAKARVAIIRDYGESSTGSSCLGVAPSSDKLESAASDVGKMSYQRGPSGFIAGRARDSLLLP